MSRCLPVAWFVVFGGLSPALAVPSAYMLTDLGFVDANGINNHGVVVGARSPSNPYTWSNGVFTNLPSFGGGGSAYDINDNGVACGQAANSGGSRYAAKWQNGTVVDLGLPAGSNWATSINDSGVAVGTNMWHAYRFSGGTCTELPAPPSPYNSYVHATGINNSGTIVGYGEVGTDELAQAVQWSGATMTPLPRLAGPRSQALGINDAGDIVGWADRLDGVRRAVKWHNGAVMDLGSAYSGTSGANAINALGDIVGWSVDQRGFKMATLFSGGQAYDLNPLVANHVPGYELRECKAMNDLGQILVQAHLPNTANYRMVLLTPVPEPVTLALLAVGGAGLLSRRRGHFLSVLKP